MADNEILQQILNGINGINTRLDRIENRMDSLESRMDSLENRMDSLESRIDSLENRIDSLEVNFNILQNRVNKLEKDVRYNTLITETELDKCIGALYEGYHLNAERFDRVNFDDIKRTTDLAMTLAKLTNDRLERWSERLKETA